LLKLGVERLPVGVDAGIAEAAVLGMSYGHILRQTESIESYRKRNPLNRLAQENLPKVLRRRYHLNSVHCARDRADRLTRCVGWPLSAASRHSRDDNRSAQVGRVEMWRGGGRLSISVSAPFVWRCLTGSAMAPFPHPAHRTGRAEVVCVKFSKLGMVSARG
jgi:hypothetical protein